MIYIDHGNLSWRPFLVNPGVIGSFKHTHTQTHKHINLYTNKQINKIRANCSKIKIYVTLQLYNCVQFSILKSLSFQFILRFFFCFLTFLILCIRAIWRPLFCFWLSFLTFFFFYKIISTNHQYPRNKERKRKSEKIKLKSISTLQINVNFCYNIFSHLGITRLWDH